MKRKLFFAVLCIASALSFTAKAQWTGNDVAAGDFYLYNIGTGKWLSSGNSWGTQASLVEAGGFHVALELSDGKYAIKIAETRTNNKAAGPGYLGTGGFMDSESAAYFTFTSVGRGDGVKAYFISDGSNNLTYSGSGTVVNFGSETGDNAQWVLVTKADRLAAMAAADDSNPVDATFLLKNAEFGRYKLPAYDAAWTFTFPGSTNKNNAGDNTNFCVESYHVAFDFAQVAEDAPKGYYAVRGQAFYRQDGSNNTDLPYFYVSDAKVQFPSKTGSEGSMTDASNSFKSGTYMTDWSSKTTFAAGNLTVGAHLDNNTALWCIWDNIQIQYYGPIDLSAYQTELAAAVSAAEAYESQIPDAVYANIASVITANNKSYETADEYSDAIAAINNAVSTYATAAIVADYARYQSIKTAALAIASSTVTSASDTAVEAATTTAAIDAAVATLRAAFQTALAGVSIPVDPGYIDVTSVLVDNASVRQNTNYWTAEGTPTSGNSWAVVNFEECEFYKQNFKFYQTLALTPATWEFGVTGFHRAGNHTTYFYAGEDKILIPGVESSVVNTMAAAKTYFDNGNGKVSLKFLIEAAGDVEIGINNQDTETDKWTIFRDFTLKYYGVPDYQVYEDQWTALVTDANTAKTAHPNVTGTELTALNAAIADSPAGANLKATYIAKIDALQTALATFNAAVASYDKYVAYRAETVTLFGESLAATVAAPTTAAEAVVAVQNLNIAQYNYVTENYTYSLTSKIGDFSTWTSTATVNGEAATAQTLNSEHWSNTTRTYYEQAGTGWSSNAWTVQYQKVANNLPAGNYVLKLAARGSVDTHGTIASSATANTVTLPSAGNNTRGITTAGVASWSDSDTFRKSAGAASEDNKGAGWQWRFLPFTVSVDGDVTLTIEAHTDLIYNWVSLADAELLSDEDKTTKVTLDDSSNMASTISSNDGELATITLNRSIKEGYNTVVLPFDLTAVQVQALFGAGSVVYSYSENSADVNSAELSFTTVGAGTITANVPVLVKATVASTQNEIAGVTIINDAEAKVAGANFDYVGVYDNTTFAEGDYFMATKDGVQKIFESDGSDTAKPFRAYFQKKVAVPVKATLLIDGVATSISEINGDNNDAATKIFNLAGQRVQKAQKGIYIVNGKKVVIK